MVQPVSTIHKLLIPDFYCFISSALLFFLLHHICQNQGRHYKKATASDKLKSTVILAIYQPSLRKGKNIVVCLEKFNEFGNIFS
jgi:hypothetical protein